MAIRFAADGAYLKSSTGLGLGAYGDWWISAWARTNVYTSGKRVVSVGINGSNNSSRRIEIYSIGGTWQYALTNSIGQNAGVNGLAVVLGAWTHLVASTSSSGGTVTERLYKNGVKASSDVTYTVDYYNAPDVVYVGNSQFPSSGACWDGDIARVSIHRGVPTFDQVRALSLGADPIHIGRLVEYWPLSGRNDLVGERGTLLSPSSGNITTAGDPRVQPRQVLSESRFFISRPAAAVATGTTYTQELFGELSSTGRMSWISRAKRFFRWRNR